MSVQGNWGRGIIGPNIVLDNLVVHYDFTNSKCYSGTGTVVNNLMPLYPNITASLSGSGASTPTLVSNTYLNFNKSNENFMYYNLQSFGASFTSIIIASSPTSTWQSTAVPSSLIYSANASNPVNGYRFLAVSNNITLDIESNSGGNSYSNNISTQTPTSLTVPNYYYFSYNNNNGSYLCGINTNSPASGITLVPSNRGIALNNSVYFSRYHPLVQPNTGGRWLDSNIYFHMYYNRALSIEEIRQNYTTLKYKFNLP